MSQKLSTLIETVISKLHKLHPMKFWQLLYEVGGITWKVVSFLTEKSSNCHILKLWLNINYSNYIRQSWLCNVIYGYFLVISPTTACGVALTPLQELMELKNNCFIANVYATPTSLTNLARNFVCGVWEVNK